ncbi:ATP-binding cassette domain-containing protein [Glaciecola sp. 1036]|uniref:ATP-binding cassette domain-containing protein n=1 Tax=Alteromonadaceae TaxID=72275 RepID=UPI003CFCC8D6
MNKHNTPNATVISWPATILTLFLILLHMTTGLLILMVASWFIAASSIAGMGFNYMLPAVIIRALALLRIASGYFSMLFGHHHLLQVLAKLRLISFAQLENSITPPKANSLDALQHQTEEVASIWISWVGQNAGFIMSLALLNGFAIFLTTDAWPVTLIFTLVFVCLYGVLLTSLLSTSAKLVEIKTQLQYRLLEHVEAAAIWHLHGNLRAVTPSIKNLQVIEQKIQFRIRTAALCLFLISIFALSYFMQVNAENMLGNPLFIILPIALLSINDWLTPSLANQQQLLNFFKAKQAIDKVAQTTKQLTPVDFSVEMLSLKGFQPEHSNIPRINANFPIGKCHLLEGSSGVGKTRILHAIAGLAAFSGARFCSKTSTNQSQTGLLRQAYYIEQFPYCLADTLRANLLVANPQASDALLEDILGKVDLAYLGSLDQWLGENGRRLSGGEKKRLGLARALLSNAKILLLDEPFESLDVKTIDIVTENLNALAMSKIVIATTHIAPQNLNVYQSINLDYSKNDLFSGKGIIHYE